MVVGPGPSSSHTPSAASYDRAYLSYAYIIPPFYELASVNPYTGAYQTFIIRSDLAANLFLWPYDGNVYATGRQYADFAQLNTSSQTVRDFGRLSVVAPGSSIWGINGGADNKLYLGKERA